MECDHKLSQIIVKDDQVFKESITLTDCPWCKLEKLKKYFTSGNSIPVERATILAKDFWEIVK